MAVAVAVAVAAAAAGEAAGVGAAAMQGLPAQEFLKGEPEKEGISN